MLLEDCWGDTGLETKGKVSKGIRMRAVLSKLRRNDDVMQRHIFTIWTFSPLPQASLRLLSMSTPSHTVAPFVFCILYSIVRLLSLFSFLPRRVPDSHSLSTALSGAVRLSLGQPSQ